MGIFYGELKDQEEVRLFPFMQTDSCGNFRQFCRNFTGTAVKMAKQCLANWKSKIYLFAQISGDA